MTAFQRAESTIAEWLLRPERMVFEEFGVTPDAWQLKALTAFADPAQQRIALQACAGPGKSAVLAWCGWNFLTCYAQRGEHPNGAATSITGDNLKKNLWKEMARWRDRSPYLKKAFEMTSDRIFARDYPRTWFIDAYSWPKTANAEEAGRTLSGLHSRFMLYLIDESGDIPPAVGRAAEQGLLNCEWGKIIQAGNPTSHDGLLYDSVTRLAHQHRVIRITADPLDPERSPRIPVADAQKAIDSAQGGRDNPWVMAYILGKFPPTSINALLGPDEIAAAMGRVLRPEQYSFSQKRIGIDVAAEGDDATVLFPRQGLKGLRPVEMRGSRGPEVSARIALAKRNWGSELELIDDTGGWAGSIIDQCHLGGIEIYRVNFASTKTFDPRYFNVRSEMHFLAAEWVKNGGSLVDMPEVAREAVAPRYWFHEGKLRVEEKAQIKSRLGKSPDFWDAFIATFALPDMPTRMGEMGLVNAVEAALADRGHAVSDWNPLEDR